MVMIANLQYGWSLFVNPIDAKWQWGRADIQVAFMIFVFTTTWLMPLAGYCADRLGARPVAMVGGVLVAASWGANATSGHSKHFMRPRQSAAPVPPPSTGRASAMRSNGFPTGADSRPA